MLRDIFRAVTGATAAIDRGVLRVMERQMSSTTPRDLPRDAREKLLQLATAYRGAPFFPEPPALGDADVTEAREPDAYDAPVTAIRFASGYRPFLPLYRDEHHRRIENHTVHARLYGTGRRPVMVCLHGWGGGTWWFEERAFVIGYWLRRGFDVALFQLPHHGERTRGRSGALFPSANLIRTNESFGQAIWDLRAFAAFARELDDFAARTPGALVRGRGALQTVEKRRRLQHRLWHGGH